MRFEEGARYWLLSFSATVVTAFVFTAHLLSWQRVSKTNGYAMVVTLFLAILPVFTSILFLVITYRLVQLYWRLTCLQEVLPVVEDASTEEEVLFSETDRFTAVPERVS